MQRGAGDGASSSVHIHCTSFPLYCTLQILLSDVDFFVSGDNLEELKIKEEEGMYPPRFNLMISCTPMAGQSKTRVEFRGARKEILFDILLKPLPLCMATGIYIR